MACDPLKFSPTLHRYVERSRDRRVAGGIVETESSKVEDGGRKRLQTVPPKTTSFSSTRARIGVKCDCRPDWRYLAKLRLQAPSQIGDEIMKSDRLTN
jgi:hypothetical protein